ncbi:MAG: pyridoxal phosphate-dependent aminotransferase [Myxococcales bacterium]|nr:pyridoxal phosphate-dependent aminotransferase [Myxococcales bacterium]
MKLSSRLSAVKPSATLAITAKANALKAAGVDVCSFGAGEPDFPTPAHICEAGKSAIDEGYTRYTASAGLPVLRKALAAFINLRYHLNYTADEVAITVGGKHALYNLFMALLDEGDEVIIPSPYWVSYPEQVRLAGGVPVIVPGAVENGFKITAAQLEAAISPRTKYFVLNSPSNPTGAAYNEEELGALADVVIKHDLFVISDEIYSELVYDGFPFRSFPTLRPNLKERTAIASGFSKTYSMTGWRLGWLAAPVELVKAADTIQSQSTSNVPGMTQMAALAALQGSHGFLDAWLQTFDRRRHTIVDGLNALEGVRCALPQGAFYVFPDFRGVLHRKWNGEPLGTDIRLTQYLLEEAHVAIVPGEPFGAPGFARFSYATSDQVIEEGLRRIRVALDKLDG